MDEKIYKHAVISYDCKTHQVNILKVTFNESEAINFLTKHINETFKLDNYLKAYYDNDKVISIYKYYYLASKELIYKFQIITFADILLDNMNI
jgi:hypothetical protein